MLVTIGGAERLGAPFSQPVAVVALSLAFLLSAATLGRRFRRDGQEHREAMRSLDIRETEVRGRAIVDSGDRRWTDQELRLLRAAERDRTARDEQVLPHPRTAPFDAARPTSRHRAG